MRVNGIVGTFSGTVSYSDESSGSFHAQMECTEQDLYWSLDQTISTEVTSQIDCESDTFLAAFLQMISDLPFISSYSWGSTWTTCKTITDAVFSLRMLISFDDNTSYPLHMTYSRGTLVDGSGTDLLSAATNSADIIAKIQLMLAKVSDVGQPVMS